MLDNLETAIIVAASIWGAVRIVEHFVPSFWDLKDRKYWFVLDERIQKLEEAAQSKTTKAK